MSPGGNAISYRYPISHVISITMHFEAISLSSPLKPQTSLITCDSQGESATLSDEPRFFVEDVMMALTLSLSARFASCFAASSCMHFQQRRRWSTFLSSTLPALHAPRDSKHIICTQHLASSSLVSPLLSYIWSRPFRGHCRYLHGYPRRESLDTSQVCDSSVLEIVQAPRI